MTRKTRWTPANIVSALRMAVAPIIVLLTYVAIWSGQILPHQMVDQLTHPWIMFTAAILFVTAGLSDILDGYLARSRNEVTNLGKFLDPLADKVVIMTALILLVRTGWAPAWIAIAIIIREVAITALRSMASAEGIIIAASKPGKYKTVTQNIAIFALLVHYDFFGLPFHLFGTVVLYGALLLTLYSGWDYMKKFFSNLQEP